MKFKVFNLSGWYILLILLAGWFVTASVIQPLLHFSFQQTGFYSGWEFLQNYSSYPGGIADYLAGFISQFFAFNTLGSFIIVAVASLQGFIALNILKRFSGELKFRFTVFALIFLFGILVLCDYRYPYYASIRLLLAFLFTWRFSVINFRSPKASLMAWPVLAVLLFYLASGSSLFVFALSSAIIAVVQNRQRIWLSVIPVFFAVSALILYTGYKFLFQITLKNLYGVTMVKPPEQLAYTPGIPIYSYYAVFPLILLIVWIYLRFRRTETVIEPAPAGKSKKGVVPVAKIRFYKRDLFLVSIQLVVFGLLSYFLLDKYHDTSKKKLITIEYLAENEQWADLLKYSKTIDKYDFRVNFQVNRAHAHLGDLPEHLFSYPQLLGVSGLFIDPTTMLGSSFVPTSDLYFDLGFMGESQRWAFEAETLLPNSPRILKRLVMINLVKGKYQLAGQFLKVLDKNLLCRDWVSKYSKYVSDTTLAAGDKLIAEKRRFSPKKELYNVGTIQGLKLLLETNLDNRMAYDYLLSFFILDTQFPEFIEYLKYYSHYNMKKMPRSWEETLAIYIMKTKAFPSFVTQETISKNCLSQFTEFNKVVRSYKNDLPAAQSILHRDYGETFWYYLLYLNPKVTNVLKTKTDVR
jgi:Family of unknown function (DUF6057)